MIAENLKRKQEQLKDYKLIEEWEHIRTILKDRSVLDAEAPLVLSLEKSNNTDAGVISVTQSGQTTVLGYIQLDCDLQGRLTCMNHRTGGIEVFTFMTSGSGFELALAKSFDCLPAAALLSFKV